MKVRSYRFQFILLFLFFGCLIALFTSLINHQLDIKNIHQAFKEAAITETNSKQKELARFTESLEDYIVALRDSTALNNYLHDPSEENYASVQSLFYGIARSNLDFMQVRFIDNKGNENVRIDYDKGSTNPRIIPKDQLQNKKHRYYYPQASKSLPNSFWYSRLDLNMENNEIEFPLKPVLRIASPVYIDQKYLGFVVINVHVKRLLNSLRESSFFNISIIDGKGEFIVHYNDIHSWSLYLQKSYNLFDDLPEYASAIINNLHSKGVETFGEVYLSSLGNLLPQDMASLLIAPKENALERMQRENRRATIFIVAIILVLSIPLAILLSQVPVRLNRKIAQQNTTLSEYVQLIDENILSSTTDKNHRIIDVSSAFSARSGYTKTELHGQDYSMLRSPHVADEVYMAIRQYVERGQTWKGELLQKSKNGKEFWTSTTVHPRIDKNGEENFWAIYQDITDKKELEVTAITDELTGLFNRRHFNSVLEKELDRARRTSTTLGFAVLDVDHFKQYNDNYGHQKGDYVLTAIGKLLNSKLSRASDFAFRLGGEEFGILFSGLEYQDAIDFAESVRYAINELNIEHKWNSAAPVITASMGFFCITPGAKTTTDEIYRIGDETLYKAKQEGRNRISAKHVDDSI